MSDKIQTDNIQVALAQIALELTPPMEYFKSVNKSLSLEDYKRRAEYFATVFAGLKDLQAKKDAQLSADVIADAFKWQG